jgi:hypothetical protein
LELDAVVLLPQHPATVSATGNQFSLTRAAPITSSAAKEAFSCQYQMNPKIPVNKRLANLKKALPPP